MTSKTVTSKDASTISYRQFGDGPGLIILHGALHTWRSHKQLAEALCDQFTVYVPDRRGRGLSSDAGSDYSMQTEVNDVEALATATGARFILGVSSGALISLRACLKLPELFKKAVVFEPPLLAVSVHELFPRFQEEIQKGDRASALITAMHMTEMGPPIFRFLPYWVGRPILRWAMSWERSSKDQTKRGEGDEGGDDPAPSLYDLVPTALGDFSLVKEMDGQLERFAAIKDTKVLLLSGTASRDFLIRCCDELEKVMPGVEHIRLQGLDHLAACNKEFGGDPSMVAPVLRKFLLEDGA